MTTFEYGIVTGLIAIAGVVLGKMLERRKYNAETEGQELDNVEKAVKIWRDLSESLQKSVDRLIVEVEELRKENRNLKAQISELKKIINSKN